MSDASAIHVYRWVNLGYIDPARFADPEYPSKVQTVDISISRSRKRYRFAQSAQFLLRANLSDRKRAPWLVTCSCGWERECSSEWAARSVAKLHPQLAPMDVAHVTRVEGPEGSP
jgi:hypothetical protein